MASTKDLKKRIGSVKNTQQTTRAMKVVSAAKLRKAQDAYLNHKPYAESIISLLKKLSIQDLNAIPHDWSRIDAPLFGKALLVCVTSERGLCGGFNSNLLKFSSHWIDSHPMTHVDVVTIGRKAYEFFQSRKKVIKNFTEISGKVNFLKAKAVTESLLKLFENYDSIHFAYNQFINAVTQFPIVEKFLPIEAPPQSNPIQSFHFMVKPNMKTVVRELLEKNFVNQTFKILLASQAGEHGARMSAMENASKNAGEMIFDLTLQFNKQRQAGITKELLEIISGSESQKQA